MLLNLLNLLFNMLLYASVRSLIASFRFFMFLILGERCFKAVYVCKVHSRGMDDRSLKKSSSSLVFLITGSTDCFHRIARLQAATENGGTSGVNLV